MEISDSSESVLLFVHGRDFKPSAEDFSDLCISALTDRKSVV